MLLCGTFQWKTRLQTFTNLPLLKMAVLYKWYGLVLYALTCLAIAQAKCKGRTVLTDLQGTIFDGPGKYPENTLCEWLIKGAYM